MTKLSFSSRLASRQWLGWTPHKSPSPMSDFLCDWFRWLSVGSSTHFQVSRGTWPDDCQHQLAILPRSEANRETAALHKIGEVAFRGRIYVVQYDAGTKVNMRNKCWLDIKAKRISDISVFTLTLTLSGWDPATDLISGSHPRPLDRRQPQD